MDFYTIKERSTKNGVIEVYPDFMVGRSKDLMTRGKSFYAIWDREKEIWSTDEYDVQRLVDEELRKHREKVISRTDGTVHAKYMSDFSTRTWSEFKLYLQNLSDNATQLDNDLAFINTKVKKEDYVSKRLPYPLEKGEINAYDEIIGTLYSEEERAKLEWAIGSIIAGDAKHIQKFIVLYGEAGAGKSTILNLVEQLFEGYYTTFEAKALTSSSNAFSTEVFKDNPLVAIQHDGDLSRIEDNTKLNSIISHEMMTMNEKYKPSYMSRINAFLFMATNKPVKITDAKSGIIRRLIDVAPSGNRIPTNRYHNLVAQIPFELGAIAHHCLEVYKEMGKDYYANYRPLDMMMQTDIFYNFVEQYYFTFKEQGGVSLSQAWEMYKVYCEEALIEYRLPRHKFREELKSYFDEFYDITRIDGRQVRSYYDIFDTTKFTETNKKLEPPIKVLHLDKDESLFDKMYPEAPAQYATKSGIPKNKWAKVKTKLKDLNTNDIHYVQPPENHIIIDFDLKNEDGEKDRTLNLEAASKWPETYAEYSKSGNGLHLHYIYEGDVGRISRLFAHDIEVKVFTGDSSLRRKLTKCNDIPVARINSGLPLKGEKMINFDTVKNEKAIRTLIIKNLNKEIHANTKPSVDFIHTILEEAYASDVEYDVTELRPSVLAFANNSSNQSDYCIGLVSKMRFKSEDHSQATDEGYSSDELAFFDIEVFPNLLVVVYKFKEKDPVIFINPTSEEVGELFRLKLVGFNCRRYDNHILYARYIGYNNNQLFNLSQKIINNSRNALFGEAYNISYTDIYEFSSKKQSLKKFELELGIHHLELGLPWDEPVDESLWPKVVEYCVNDVEATEAIFYSREQDFVARQILADISGLSVNDTTQQHTARIIFGHDRNPQRQFVYTDLSVEFPGYTFDFGKSLYRDEEVGEGGYVYAEPGIYENVVVLDVESQHPISLIELNHFGPYTEKFKELVYGRLAIKHEELDILKTMLDGKISKYVKDDQSLDELSYALKIVINIVYGMTSAKFENKFKDPRNKDNIVAKRGALFMIDLKHAVQDKGYQVAHIKTDSIKIPNADEKIIEFVKEFGKEYGYSFEHESTFDKFCLVNDAVYIARENGEWDAVGAQFAHPYVFKTMFSGEPIEFKDLCETKTVTTALYLDMNEKAEEEHDYHFVGKAGAFCPIKPGAGGGLLMREKDGGYNAASGTKGFRWLEAQMVKDLELQDDIDFEYFRRLVDKAIDKINNFGDYDEFVR